MKYVLLTQCASSDTHGTDTCTRVHVHVHIHISEAHQRQGKATEQHLRCMYMYMYNVRAHVYRVYMRVSVSRDHTHWWDRSCDLFTSPVVALWRQR